MNPVLKKVNENILKMVGNEIPVFMYIETDSKGRDRIKMSPSKLMEFLVKSGFCLFEGKPIQIVAGVAREVEGAEVFQFCLKHVKSFADEACESLFLTSGETLLVTKKGTLLGLPESELEPVKDDRETAYVFRANGVVKIYKKARDTSAIEFIDYPDLEGFVWNSYIKEREFTLLGEENTKGSVFRQFLMKVTNDNDHMSSMMSGLGYIVHGYKDPTNPRCLIINDENLEDNGQAEGGTGKGLLVKAISHMVTVAYYNGKNSDFSNNQFAYQNVNRDTRVLAIDDVNMNFPLRVLFSVLTEHLTVEKKRKDPIVIPFADSPKFVITTNYTIMRAGSSTERRRVDLFLNDTYGANRSPFDDFEQVFFTGWDAEEWNKFDNFMISCIMHYLDNGLVKYHNDALELKMLKTETSREFWEVMDANFSSLDRRYHKIALRSAIVAENPKRFHEKLAHKTLKIWIDKYADFNGLKVAHGRDMLGTFYTFESSEA